MKKQRNPSLKYKAWLSNIAANTPNMKSFSMVFYKNEKKIEMTDDTAVTQKVKIEIKCDECKNKFTRLPKFMVGRGIICPFCLQKEKRIIIRDRFISSMKEVNPNWELIEYPFQAGNIKVNVRCHTHKITFRAYANNVLNGYGCHLCRKETDRPNNPLTMINECLSAYVKTYLIETYGNHIVEQENLSTVIRSVCKQIISNLESDSSLKNTADLFTDEGLSKLPENFIKNIVDNADVDIFYKSNDFKDCNQAALEKKNEKKVKYDEAIKEWKETPNSQLCHTTDGCHHKTYYLKLIDNQYERNVESGFIYKIIGEEGYYKTIGELNGAIGEIQRQLVLDKQLEKEKEKKVVYQEEDIIVIPPETIKEEIVFDPTPFIKQIEDLNIDMPEQNMGVWTYQLKKQSVFFLLNKGKWHVIGTKVSFIDFKDMLMYLDTLTTEKYDSDSDRGVLRVGLENEEEI